MAILICAHDLQYGIGINNSLPWQISEDMKYFKNQTFNSYLLCGRNTLCSLPASMPDRQIVAVSKTLQKGMWGNVAVYDDMNLAFEETKLKAESEGKNLFIIGGKTIYSQLEDKCDKLLVTVIHKTYKCDTYYKPNEKNLFKLLNEETINTKSGVDVTFQDFERKTE
jgi:dihydrofolate reductase